MALTSRQARHLRALAHPLDPVVRVGQAGLTDAVIDKTDKELEIHELLKVKGIGPQVLQQNKANLQLRDPAR